MKQYPQLTHQSDRLHGLSIPEAGQRLAYGTFLGANSRYIFMENPKAACSTLKWILADIEQRKVTLKNTGVESSAAMGIHLRANHGIPSLMSCAPPQFDALLADDKVVRFCVVRNPYTRVLSAWADKIRQREPNYADVWRRIAKHQGLKEGDAPSFTHFVRWITAEQDVKRCNHHWRGMTWLLLPDLMRYTHILKTETLAEDLGRVLVAIAPGKDADVMLRTYKLNESLPLRNWRAFYNEELAALIHTFYREDFERFGYSIDSWRITEMNGDGGDARQIESLLRYTEALEERALEAIRSRNDMIAKALRHNDAKPGQALQKFISGGSEVPDLLRDLGAELLQAGQSRRARDLFGAADSLPSYGTHIRQPTRKSVERASLTSAGDEPKKIGAERTVLVLGDSHVAVFKHSDWKKLTPKIEWDVSQVDGATLSGLQNPNSKTGAAEIFHHSKLKKRVDLVVLMLGEVDTGFVIWYRAQSNGGDVYSFAHRAIENYDRLIREMARSAPVVVISTPLPTIPDGAMNSDVARARAEVKATLRERTDLTRWFNTQVRLACEKNGAIFVDLDPHSIDTDGLVLPSLRRANLVDHHYASQPYIRILGDYLLPVVRQVVWRAES